MLAGEVFVPSLVIGGVAATLAQVDQAAEALEAWPSTTVRPVLAPLGNPLAACDYHAAGAPYRHLFTSRPGHRGAAGAPVTRLAFIAALRAEGARARGNPAALFAGIVTAALAAFGSDESYAAEIARAAVAQSRARHHAAVRARLRQAVHRAVSACDARQGQFTCTVAQDGTGYCGTGACVFASGELATVRAAPGPGRLTWPVNSSAAGTSFDPSAALGALLAARPFAVAIKVSAADRAVATDEVAA